jgi:hypothetical protein
MPPTGHRVKSRNMGTSIGRSEFGAELAAETGEDTIEGASLHSYVGDRLWRWLMKKHGSLHRKRSTIRRLPSLVRPTRKVWREEQTEQFLLASLRVERFRRGWMRTPAFAMVPGEPDA